MNAGYNPRASRLGCIAVPGAFAFCLCSSMPALGAEPKAPTVPPLPAGPAFGVNTARSLGYALVLPFKERLLFAAMGSASGFPPEKSQLVDHCTPGAEGGCAWGVGRWDHWPIGWLNSQTSLWKPASPYPYSFGSIGHFIVPAGKRIRSFGKDYPELCGDRELNRWPTRRVFYVLLGAARDWDDIRRIARTWLDKGAACARPESIADLR